MSLSPPILLEKHLSVVKLSRSWGGYNISKFEFSLEGSNVITGCKYCVLLSLKLNLYFIRFPPKVCQIPAFEKTIGRQSYFDTKMVFREKGGSFSSQLKKSTLVPFLHQPLPHSQQPEALSLQVLPVSLQKIINVCSRLEAY